MFMKHKLSDRITELIISNGLTQKKFLQQVEPYCSERNASLSKQMLCNLLQGRANTFSDTIIESIASAFGVSEAWLAGYSDLSFEEELIAKAYSEADDEERETVRFVLRKHINS